MRISWLGDVLTATGLQVVAEGDWLNRTVSGPTFEPIGVLWHHTAATVTSASNPHPALNVCIYGRPDLSGPLCHALVDYRGVFHLISANRANHAGTARASGPIPEGSGNTMLIGWEIDYAGDQSATGGPRQAMSTAQYNASVAATGAVLARLGRSAEYARGHRETSTTGKIDPSFCDLTKMRADVAAKMKAPPGMPYETWVSDVNVRSTPDTSRAPVGSLPDPTTVYVQCQTRGQSVTYGGYTNDRWAKISSPVAGYISNVFIKGPASLPVSTCAV